jgi:hypothetical protein
MHSTGISTTGIVTIPDRQGHPSGTTFVEAVALSALDVANAGDSPLLTHAIDGIEPNRC